MDFSSGAYPLFVLEPFVLVKAQYVVPEGTFSQLWLLVHLVPS